MKKFFFSQLAGTWSEDLWPLQGPEVVTFYYGGAWQTGHCHPYEGTDSFTSMPYPGLEPGTLGVAVGSPIHNTIWSAYEEV